MIRIICSLFSYHIISLRQNVDVHKEFYAKKTLVNATDSTYPKSIALQPKLALVLHLVQTDSTHRTCEKVGALIMISFLKRGSEIIVLTKLFFMNNSEDTPENNCSFKQTITHILIKTWNLKKMKKSCKELQKNLLVVTLAYLWHSLKSSNCFIFWRL